MRKRTLHCNRIDHSRDKRPIFGDLTRHRLTWRHPWDVCLNQWLARTKQRPSCGQLVDHGKLRCHEPLWDCLNWRFEDLRANYWWKAGPQHSTIPRRWRLLSNLQLKEAWETSTPKYYVLAENKDTGLEKSLIWVSIAVSRWIACS